jgi:diguanylate cyclase (GGDEF)-like protein
MQGTESGSWLRGILRRYGVVAVTVGATLLSILLSLTIMALLSELDGGPITREALVISILAPAIIAPLLSFHSFQMLAQLDEAERRLKALSTLDELTGAFNRRHFMELALYELENAERDEGHLSIAILDFDNFKLINDRFGHLAGDQALREVSRICRETIRKTDIFARYGGDEFIFLFPHTAGPEALECLERIIEKISVFSFESQGRMVDPRVSIGVHSFGTKSRTLDTILEKADLALYKSKQMGGSRVSG